MHVDRAACSRAVVTTSLLVACSQLPVSSQGWPPPIDLRIQNIPQETQVWCWAAVAQQIILRSQGPQLTPPQCALVAMANGAPPQYCCDYLRQECVRTGSLTQIQWLIQQFGGRLTTYAYPADPMTVYNTLASGRAIIMAVQSTPFAGHVVVIRGMRWVPTRFGPTPELLVNDPMSYFSQPIPFNNIAQFWQHAIVVY